MKKTSTLFAAALMIAACAYASDTGMAPILKKMDTSKLRDAKRNAPQAKIPADLGGNFSSWELLGNATFNAEAQVISPCDATVYYCTTDPTGMGVDSWCVEGVFGNVIRIAGMPFIDFYNINNFDTGLTYQGKPVMVDDLTKYYNVGIETMVYPEMGKIEMAMLYYVDDPSVVDNVIAYGLETIQIEGDYRDYKVDMSVAGETRDGKSLKVDLNFADATNVKTAVFVKDLGYNPAEDDELKSLVADVRSNDDFDIIGTPGSLYLPLDCTGTYLVVTTYDTDQVSEDNYKIATYDYEAEWEEWGSAEYTDDFLASYYDEFPINTAKGIKVERHASDERYRMVNPYTTDDTWTSVWSRLQPADPEVNSYMEINAVNPEHTYIVIAPSDITDGDGVRLVMGSAAHYNLINGRSEDAITERGYWGSTTYTDDNNTVSVSFPRMVLMMRQITSEYPLFAGYNDSFALVMKSSVGTGISEIATGETSFEPEYLDMQGVRVKNPVAPGIYIKRSGSKTEKIVVK